MAKYSPVQYSDYLQLTTLLSAQKPRSVELNKPAHDEMLFIVVHQAHELWFKQIIYEIDSVLAMFASHTVDEKNLGVAVSRLARVTEIQKVLIDHLRVLETMTPLDFLEFRDMLVPASGFQSFQFRIVENKLGLKPEQRLEPSQGAYRASLCPFSNNDVNISESSPSLFDSVEKWLERTPFLEHEGYQFWIEYQTAVNNRLSADADLLKEHLKHDPDSLKLQLLEVEKTKKNFAAIFDEKHYAELPKRGARSFSYKALHAALFIQLYRDEPILHLPFRLLNSLMDIDELFTQWRNNHALMVHRMIGTKIGTGGSSGYGYLKGAAERHKIFGDLFDLSTYLIPRSDIPSLPKELKQKLGFHYSNLNL